MWYGQGVGLVQKLQPAAEILHEIHDQGSSILKQLSKMSV